MSSPMSPEQFAKQIDHTLLKSDATREAIIQLCRETEIHGFASACIHPYWIREMASIFPKLRLCTVIGFPLGLQTVKLYEGQKAIEDGALELDIVINPAAAAEKNWTLIAEELQSFRKVFADITLKHIIETSLLDEERIITLTKITRDSGFDWIKTSTGFVGEGANPQVIKWMKQHCDKHLQIKASGGIRTLEIALSLLDAGATRLGTSSGITLLKEYKSKD